MSDNKTELARSWYKLQADLADLKEAESALRKEVVAAFFGDSLDAGTHKTDLTENVKLVVSVPKKITLNKASFEEHRAELLHRGFIGDDKLIRVKYEVSSTALKHLSDQDKVKFNELFVHSTGSPQVTVEVKKG